MKTKLFSSKSKNL